MTDTEMEVLETADPEDTAEMEAAEPALTEADVTARILAEKAAWDAERAAQIASLTEEIHTLRRAAARRETEIRCGKMLREHALTEDLSAILLSPEETEVSEEILLMRVSALAGAVEAAAVRALREKTEIMRPGVGTDAPLSGKIIRETPIAQLSRML